MDSIAPVVRFATLVVLFTAACTWIQVVGRRNAAQRDALEPPRTASQQPIAPEINGVERSVTPPTAAGPVGTTPQPAARVGRVRENDDFAASEHESDALPRLQTTEPNGAGVVEDPAHSEATAGSESADRAPEIARLPGFIIEIPSR